ncbi:hypothetical protein [Spirosoma foliorum]|uniref:Ig-like domain-containing protein n=1 Tax=Spirosoma foliorum TaxID=2710596 RepID=A0A7G5H2W0_9BACT|nr:hypothetical protein [Spirosoma foliorum]QMW05452.1 hypothetical protein H3H32_11450 [Spirosoma foliorum]
MKKTLLPKPGSHWLGLLLTLALLLTYGSQARLRVDDPTLRPGLKSIPDKPSGAVFKTKPRRTKRQQVPVSNDPIRFTLQASKRQLTVGEEVELTVTAQLMTISPNLMFFLPGSNAYTLKLLTPSGFQSTGGDFSEYVRGELTAPATTVATYHLRGFFSSPSEGEMFRLLRGDGQANSQSLYEEKARLQLVVQAETKGAARLDDPCSGISLSAQASPATISGGGSVTLSASCSGCSSGGGSFLYTSNFDGQVPNTSFQSDYSDQVKVIANAQNGTDTYYCSVTDRSGAGGSLLRFNGESTGRIWEKSLNVVSGTTYSFSVWVQPIYNGSVASGATQQSLQLKANGVVLASPTFGASNPGCSGGWVQLSGSWTATTSGSVPFTIQVPTGSSWQQAFVLDDIQINSSGGGSSASYSWQALETGSNIASSNNATTTVTVPTSVGTYHYRVTLSSGSCTTAQDVTVAVTGTSSCSGISLSAQASPATISGGGSVTLSASCSGCSSGGGSFLYTTNFDGQVPNTSFQSDYSDQVKVIANAQNGTDTYYCSVTDRSGAGGSLLRFNGESTGRIWEKSLNVVSGTTYSFSVWVQPIYNGSVASGATQQSLQLKANGVVLASPTFGASNPGCSGGWVQLSGSWTATTSGSVPFTIQVPTGSSWQQAFVLDDIQINSNGGGSSASYSWQALESGSSIASSNSATTTVTVPTSAGTYHYRVTLTSGSCTTAQDVTVATSVPCNFTPTASVTNAAPACGSTVSLSASCTGSDCSGVTYAWTGPNGFTQSGQSVSATVPTGSGSYNYTITLSKSNCSSTTATVAISTNCSSTTTTPHFYVGRSIASVFDPELYQLNGDWYIRDKVTAATYTDDRPRRYQINRAHVAVGSLNGYKLGQRGGRYIIEMTRWRGNSYDKDANGNFINGMEAFRMEFILPGSMDEVGAIQTPSSFVPSENYIDNSVAMIPAHDTLTGKITAKVKYNMAHTDVQLYGLGANYLSRNASETNPNKIQIITGSPWDDGGPNSLTRQQFNQLSDDYIKTMAQQQGVTALYFTDFETENKGWSDVALSGDNDATIRKLYTYHEALIASHPGRLITDYYRYLVNNKGFPDSGDGRPNPLEQRYKDHYTNPNGAIQEAYRPFNRENGTTVSARNLYTVWLVDNYGRQAYDPDNQYELYRLYSTVHDSRISRKLVSSTQKIISYAWAGTDQDIGYTLKREIPGKGWVGNYARRYKSAATVEAETYIGYLINDGYIPFHDQRSSSNNPENACFWGDDSDSWDPIGNAQSPLGDHANCYPREPQYYNEHVNLAEYKLSQVNDILNGGYAEDAQFSLDGGTTWLNTEGETAILYRASNKQHIVLKKVVGNQAFVMAVNPFAGEADKFTLTVQLANGWTDTITTTGKWPTLKRFSH